MILSHESIHQPVGKSYCNAVEFCSASGSHLEVCSVGLSRFYGSTAWIRLKAYLRRHGLVVADLESGETECQHLFPNVKNLIEWYHSRFSSVAPPVDLSKKLASRELSAALDSVKRGAIWLEKIEEPEFFVLKLKKNSSSLDCKARIAAILSLWHTAAMTRPL
jgi:hypothetical protein